jgi:hypothetical protein
LRSADARSTRLGFSREPRKFRLPAPRIRGDALLLRVAVHLTAD